MTPEKFRKTFGSSATDRDDATLFTKLFTVLSFRVVNRDRYGTVVAN
jgi:hypothetical protein